MWHFFAAVLFASIIVLPQSGIANELVIHSDTGSHTFSVEIMRTPQERSKGLMHRKSLDADAGMLFDFGASTPVSMWMKNTYIPLDMIFISEAGIIRSIAENTTPLSTEIISSNARVKYVLEVIAGTSANLQIKPGDKITLPISIK